MTRILPFDPEVITARILAEDLRGKISDSGVMIPDLSAQTGLTTDVIYSLGRGEGLRGAVQLFTVLDALRYDVVFRKRETLKRMVRLL